MGVDVTGPLCVGTGAEGNPTGFLTTARDGTVVQPRLPEAMVRRLLEVDGRRHAAMVATVDGECVGIGRYIMLADEPGVARWR